MSIWERNIISFYLLEIEVKYCNNLEKILSQEAAHVWQLGEEKKFAWKNDRKSIPKWNNRPYKLKHREVSFLVLINNYGGKLICLPQTEYNCPNIYE